jgi:hypothetical protein
MKDNRFQRHNFHAVEIVTYKSLEWSLECTDCNEVIIDEVAWEMMNKKEVN